MKRVYGTIVLFIIIFGMLTVMSSCAKENDVSVENTKGNNDIIQLWNYDYTSGESRVNNIIENVKKFCEEKNIPLELHLYSSDIMEREDYILKRNVAATAGNTIIIDDISYLHTIAEHHADYSKLENYDKLVDAYKERFCIPLGILYMSTIIEDYPMLHYGIDISQKPVITYREYLNIKQEMKEEGAKFTLNYREFDELIRYYLDKNELLFINGDSEIFKDNKKFEEMLRKSIIDICSDIVSTNSGKLEEIDFNNQKANDGRPKYVSDFFKKEQIFDENSQLVLSGEYRGMNGLNVEFLVREMGILYNKVFILNPTNDYSHNYIISPCFYMYKKVTNDKIYDVANFIVSDSVVKTMSGSYFDFIPVLITESIKSSLSVDEEWKIVENYRKITPSVKRVVDATNEIIYADEVKSNEFADYVFSSEEYAVEIKSFVENTVIDIAKMLSGNYKLSLEKFDIKNDEISKMIDNKVSDYVKNFYIVFNN